MHISDLLAPRRIRLDAPARSKKNVLELVARLLADEAGDLSERKVFSSLCQREKLGSTGFGHGVALPHGRLEGLTIASGAFVRLADPVDFEASDGEKVDLVFAMIVPEDCGEPHLEMLSQLAEIFAFEERRDALRKIEHSGEIIQFLSQWEAAGMTIG